MIIKNTPWEKRNLGVDSSVEFYIGQNDRIADIEIIRDHCEIYQVAHVAPGNVDALIFLQSENFVTLEMNIQLKRSLGKVELPGVYRRYEKVLSHRYAEENEVDRIIEIVKNGHMFRTDKIALDPFFGEEYAGKRYALWSGDVLSNGGIVVLSLYKDSPVGFEIYTEEDQKCTNFIGGVFPEFESKGLGFAPLYSELLDQQERGNKTVITGVSSNNIPVLKLHDMLGYKVDSMSYILVKHIER